MIEKIGQPILTITMREEQLDSLADKIVDRLLKNDVEVGKEDLNRFEDLKKEYPIK